jgi:hypothetical protein
MALLILSRLSQRGDRCFEWLSTRKTLGRLILERVFISFWGRLVE